MWSCKTLADGLNCWLNPAAALPRETVPRSLGLVSDSSGWLGTKPAPAAVSPLPQLSGEGVKEIISALLAVVYGFGSDFCVVALMWDGERKLQALLLCLFLSRGLLTVAGCLEELCSCSMRGGKGLVIRNNLRRVVKPAQGSRCCCPPWCDGVCSGSRRPPAVPQPLLQLAVGRAGCRAPGAETRSKIGGSWICCKCCKQNQAVSEDPSGDLGLAFGVPELAASGLLQLGSLQLAETRPREELHH